MNKIVWWIIVFILIGFGVWAFWYFQNEDNTAEKKIIKNELLQLNFENKDSDEEEFLENITIIDRDKEEQIEILRKRFSLRGTIARWDDYAKSNQPILALNEYLKALRQSPNDEQIIKKLAWVYFELKRFQNAKTTFEKVLSTLNSNEKETYIYTLLYTLNFKSSDEIKNTSKIIRSLWLSKEETFYYINAINCTINFHECKKNFDIFFKNVPELSFSKLIQVQRAIRNYENFQIEHLYYKNALIIWAFFQDKLYTISNILWQQMLQEMPDYKPILLVTGKGYYELWDLENAKKYLEQYYSLDPHDLDITYTLWDINFRQKDYLTSNLYFNSALKNGFEPQVELQRKLAYNFYLSGDKRSMLNVFGYLTNDKNATIDDFSLWIYHAILEGRTGNARNWAKKWQELFQGKDGVEIFYGYLGWIEREDGNYEKADEYLKKWLQINPRNPLITLNLWYLEESKERYSLALMYFKRTINLNGDGEFWELAKGEANAIEKYLQMQK